LHREDPQRTEPLRQWSTLYRSPDSGSAPDAAGPPPEPEQGETWNDVVAEGVAVGYRVLEEQLRQGQRVAEQIGDASYGPAAMTGDVREATERMVRYSADLVALWLDFVNATFGNGDLLRAFSAGWPPAAGTAAPMPAAAPPAVSIEIASRRPLRVSLDLKPGATARPLAAHPLRALEADTPALAELTFERGGDGGSLALRIRVPEAQPAGIYTGVVVDRGTGEPLGTVTARLSD
jgi:hypothetical protein